MAPSLNRLVDRATRIALAPIRRRPLAALGAAALLGLAAPLSAGDVPVLADATVPVTVYLGDATDGTLTTLGSGTVGSAVDVGPQTLADDEYLLVRVDAVDDGDAGFLDAQLGTTSPVGISACAAQGTWHEHVVPLDAAWGIVRVRFEFDSADTSQNTFDGWFIDDLELDLGTIELVSFPWEAMVGQLP